MIAGDAEQAAELLRKHVVVQGERFADLMALLHRIEEQPSDRARLPRATSRNSVQEVCQIDSSDGDSVPARYRRARRALRVSRPAAERSRAAWNPELRVPNFRME